MGAMAGKDPITNTLTLQAGDEVKLRRNLKTSISEDEKAPHMRSYSDGFDAYTKRAGRDIGVKAAFMHSKMLIITGDAKDASLDIPTTVSAENKDVPHLQIDTDAPLEVKGGSFILTAASKGKAFVDVEAGDRASMKLSADPVTASLLLSITDEKLNTRIITLEPGSPGVDITDPDSRKVLATISDKKSLEENKAALAALSKPEAPKEMAAPNAPQPDANVKMLSDAEYNEAFNLLSKTRDQIDAFTKNDNGKALLQNHPELAGKMAALRSSADTMLDGQSLNKNKMNEFQKSLNEAITLSAAVKDDFKSRNDNDRNTAGDLEGGLRAIKKKIDGSDALKISMAPNELPDHVRALASSAGKALTTYTDVGVFTGTGQGTKIASITETTLNPNKSHTF